MEFAVDNVQAPFIPKISVDQGIIQEAQDEAQNSRKEQINNASMTEATKCNLMFRIPNTKIHYHPLKNIGQGATSTVHLGSYGDSDFNCSVAVKLVKQTGKNVHKKELQIWKHLLSNTTETSINIVRFFDWGQYENIVDNFKRKESAYVLAMELANCNLRQYIIEDLNKDVNHLKSLCLGVSNGLEFLHKNNILHRDIKPENVLIFQNGPNKIAKLGDFGFSSMLNNESTCSVVSGTEVWMPPEALESLHQGKKFKGTKAVDIFSLGMTFYFTLSNSEHPFAQSEKYGRFPEMNIKDAEVQPGKLQDNLKYTEKDLVEMMMSKRPEERPSIQTVINHPMFWNNKKCLEYICYIAGTTNDKFEPKCEQLRREIEEEYQQYHKIYFSGQLDWISKIDSRLLSRKGRGRKNYVGSLIMSLLELIRDKREHHKDMLSELMLERFSTSGEFSEEKYMEYFMHLFPYLVIFLYSSFTKRSAMHGNWTDDSSFNVMAKIVSDDAIEINSLGPPPSKREKYYLSDDSNVDVQKCQFAEIEKTETIHDLNFESVEGRKQLMNEGHEVKSVQMQNDVGNIGWNICDNIIRNTDNDESVGRTTEDKDEIEKEDSDTEDFDIEDSDEFEQEDSNEFRQDNSDSENSDVVNAIRKYLDKEYSDIEYSSEFEQDDSDHEYTDKEKELDEPDEEMVY